jgi:hypothetical protein
MAAAAGRKWESPSALLVVSHDCDVACPKLDQEPTVEVLHGTLVEDLSGTLKHGKNPRVIHLPLQLDGAGRIVEGWARNRFFADRRYLGLEPPAGSLAQMERRQLRRWLAGRYVRAAFPDEFNERVRPAADKIHKQAAKKGADLTALFLYVRDEELESGTDYEIELIATMSTDSFNEPEARQVCQQLLNKIETELDKCAGIRVMESELRSEAEISLDDLALLKRWDWEYLSLRNDPPEPAAPHP